MLSRKPVNRRKDQPSRLQWLQALGWRRLSLLALAAAAALGVGLTLLWYLNQPIQSISVAGSFQRVSAAELEKVARQHIAGAGLISVDLAEVRRALRSLAWIDEVAVQRSWPRSLRLRVQEQVAIARWNSSALVNERGEVFRSDERAVPAGLPLLSGPDGAEGEVVARYMAIQGAIVEAGAHLSALQMDERGAWRMTLESGVEVRLGRAQVDARFRRFLDVALPQINSRVTEIAYIDMRYSNGYAIGWKSRAPKLASHMNTEGLIPDA